MFKMLIGISLISVAAEMFLSDTGFKKYIKAVLGVFIFVIMLEGIFSVSLSFDRSILDKAERMADIAISGAEEQVIKTYAKNIRAELSKNNIETVKVNILCDPDLTLRRVVIILKKINEKEKATRILSENFGIYGDILEIRGGE